MRAQYGTRLATLKTTNHKDGRFLIIILSKLRYNGRIDDRLKSGDFYLQDSSDREDSSCLVLIYHILFVLCRRWRARRGAAAYGNVGKKGQSVFL